MNFLCFGLANLLRLCYTMQVSFGVWRSLVARSAGGREVAGSNPVTPIKKEDNVILNIVLFLIHRKFMWAWA